MASNDELSGRIQSVDTTFAIVELIRERGTVGVTEVAESLDRSKSTVHHYLATLENRGYLECEGDEYSLGLRFLTLGGTARDREPLFHLSRADVDRLAAETGEKARLIVERDWHGITLHQAEGDQVDETRTCVGSTEDLYSTAAGKALLAALPSEQVDEYIQTRDLTSHTANTITDPDRLRTELDRIRSRGVALDDEEHYDGVRCVAAPVSARGRGVLGTLSVSAPSDRLDDDRFRSTIPDKLQTAAGVVEVNSIYSAWTADQ